MSTFSILQLEDRARDVDPDLRYMALEDFQKGLNNPKVQVRGVSRFTPLLFKLLSDPTTEVQNQAVKSFSPLVRHVDDDEILQIVNQLYDEVIKASSTSKFTTSVPNLALRSIFNDSHSRFSKALSKRVVDSLLPKIFSRPLTITINKIELLIDLIKCLGSVLSEKELLTVVLSLIESAFTETGIVSKRSIIAVDSALAYVQQATLEHKSRQSEFYDEVIISTCSNYREKISSATAESVLFSIFQVVLAQLRKSKHLVLSESSARTIFDVVVVKLDYSNVVSSIDVEDLDIDVFAAENLVREDALITLSSFLPCIPYDWFFHTYAAPVAQIIEAFISFDPLAYQDDSDIEDYDDSGIEFSDDEIEQFDDASDSDGLASRLRLQAIILINRMLQAYPQTLVLIYSEHLFQKVIVALNDRNETVSNEAIVSAFSIVNATSSLSENLSSSHSDISLTTEGNKPSAPEDELFEKYCPQLESKILDVLLTTKNIKRFPNTKILIESLVSTVPLALSKTFLSCLLEKFFEFNLSLKTYPDIIYLYRAIASAYEYDLIVPSLVNYILDDIIISLEDLNVYHTFVFDILQVCKIFFEKAAGNAAFQEIMNNSFFNSIAEKVTLKHYTSEVRQHLLSTLSELVINVDLNAENIKQANTVFQESLDYEVTVNFTIENLINVCDKKPELFNSEELCNLIISKLNLYLGSSDSSLYVDVLLLLDKLFEKAKATGDPHEISSLSSNIIDIIKSTTDQNSLTRSFKILGHTLSVVPADRQYFEDLIKNVINVKFADLDDFNFDTYEFLIKQIVAHNTSTSAELFAAGMQLLILKNFVAAKTMALIATEYGLVDEVRNVEKELIEFCENRTDDIDADKTVFDINFLGCVCSKTDFLTINFDNFFAILNNSASDTVCLAAARALGLSIIKNLDNYLPTLLACYQKFSAEENPKAKLLLVAVKQVLKEETFKDNIDNVRGIWDLIFHVILVKQGSLTHKDVSELRLAGDVLTRVTVADKTEDYQSNIFNLLSTQTPENCNEFLVYTIVVIIKQLMSRNTESFNVRLMEKVLQFLPKPNLELKQAIISTLLTGIYNKSISFGEILNDIILPRIYDELSAKEEFKKVIPMGPYKYIVDEGLEVRKLSYELISAIIVLDTSKIRKEENQIDQVSLFETLLAKGLNDSENDVILLTIGNLLQIIQGNENVITMISNQQEFIASLTKLMNKKLRSKASTQELESYEDTLRSMIKLSKVIQNILIHTNTLSSEWSTYYNELKNKHYLLFSAVEM